MARDSQTHLGLGPYTPTLQYGSWAQSSCPKLGSKPAEAMGPSLITLHSAQNPLNEPL